MHIYEMHEIEQMQQLVSHVTQASIRQVCDLLFQEEARIKYATQPKLAMEMAVFRLLEAAPALPIEELIEKLDLLRGELNHRPPPSTPEPPAEENPGGSPAGIDSSRSGKGVELSSAWQRVQQIISSDHPSLAANLSRCKPTLLSGDHIELAVSGNGFHLGMIQRSDNMDIIKKVCDDIFAHPMRITVTAHGEPDEQLQKRQLAERKKDEALNHPLVTDALEIFNGRVVDVKFTSEDGQ